MTDFHLIETMLFEPANGVARRDLHMARLKRSANRLGFRGADDADGRLTAFFETPPQGARHGPQRVRLTLEQGGDIAITAAPFTPLAQETVWQLRIAETRLSSSDTLLRYKTSRRDVYERARSEFGAEQADEVLLLNEHGAPCEGTITSLFLDDGSGQLKTPPISCGLLAGILRTQLICQRRARVERFGLNELRAGSIYVGNSLRGLIPARLVGDA